MAEVKITIEEGVVKKNLSQCMVFLRRVFHLIGFCDCIVVTSFGMKFLGDITDEQLKDPRVWDSKYLVSCYATNWNLLFQTTFLFLAVSHDVLEWTDRQESQLGRLVRYWRDVVFSGLVVPITMFVTGMFWSIYSIDRELVFPIVYDDIVPWWFNHCVHTNIFIIICLETLLQARRRPVDVKTEHICVMTVLISYAVVYYSVYFISHRWLYQVFGVMNWWQVCLFQCLIWISSYCFYRIQYPINRLIHGSTDEEKAETKSQTNGNIIYTTEISQDKADGATNGDVVAANDNGNVNKGGEVVGEANDGKKDVISSYRNGTMESSLKKPPFADRSWSLKYRTIRNQFENSSL